MMSFVVPKITNYSMTIASSIVDEKKSLIPLTHECDVKSFMCCTHIKTSDKNCEFKKVK